MKTIYRLPVLVLACWLCLSGAAWASGSPPAAVTNLAAVHNGASVSATWTAPAGAVDYHVTYSNDGGSSWMLGASALTDTSISITDAQPGKKYIVAVRARNEHGYSGWVNSTPAVYPFTQAPGAVVNLTATHHGTAVTATWDAPSGVEFYHVTYSSDGGASWSLAESRLPEVPNPSVRIAQVDSSKSYIVGVRAGNAIGWSGWRNSAAAGYDPPDEVTHTVEPTATPVSQPVQGQTHFAPAVPSGITALHNGSSVTVSWSAVTFGHDSSCGENKAYYFRHRQAGNSTWSSEIYVPPYQTSFSTSTSVAAGTNHEVQVAAWNGGHSHCKSAWSNTVTALVPSPTPNVPTQPGNTLKVRCEANVCTAHDVRTTRNGVYRADDRWVQVASGSEDTMPACKKSPTGNWFIWPQVWYPGAAPSYIGAGGTSACVKADRTEVTYTLTWTCHDAMLMHADYHFTIPVGDNGTYNPQDHKVRSYSWLQPQNILYAYQDTNGQWWSGIEWELGKAKITEGPPDYVNPTGAKAGTLCYATATQ